jgi:hypothetical protein
MLTAFPDLSVTLSWNGREVTLLGRELQPRLRRELVRLLVDRVGDIHTPADVGGGRGRENGSDNEIYRSGGRERDPGRDYETSFSSSLPGSEDEESRGEGVRAVDSLVDALALLLARTFTDLKSLAWYRLVAAHVSLSTIRDALSRALELEPREVRRSRAAYFTAIVRPHLAKSRTNRQA